MKFIVVRSSRPYAGIGADSRERLGVSVGDEVVVKFGSTQERVAVSKIPTSTARLLEKFDPTNDYVFLDKKTLKSHGVREFTEIQVLSAEQAEEQEQPAQGQQNDDVPPTNNGASAVRWWLNKNGASGRFTIDNVIDALAQHNIDVSRDSVSSVVRAEGYTSVKEGRVTYYS